MVRKDDTYFAFSEPNCETNAKFLNDQNQNLISSDLYPSTITSFTCIIADLTDPNNTCRRHVINLSSSYTIDNLIKEAASYFSYDPYSFNLMWKNNKELLNITEIQSLNLADLGLSSESKNIFEIHEKEGPPKRIKIDSSTSTNLNNESNFNSSNLFEEERWKPQPINSSLTRRNAVYNTYESSIEYGPVNLNSTIQPYYVNNEDENTGYVGLINQAMTCYLNSLIQTLYMTPEFRNGIYRWNYSQALNEQEDPNKSIPFQLQRLFLNLQTSNKKSIQTHDLTKSFGWNSDDAFQQHDIQELCRVMFDALEKKFKNTKQENLINELYQGKIKDYVKCLECNTESARVDVYLDVPLCIRPFGSDKTFDSVETALDAFIQPEILDENNKYFCEKCKRMCKAHKGLKFESFPYIISLQLKRFDFDYKTLSRFKIGSTVSFPEILNVKKYLENLNNDENEQDNNLYDYELFSIMIHSGSASGGHYYAYIKSFENNQWYNFNDERVTKIDKSDIIKAFGTSYSVYSSTTAYMLQYRQINKNKNQNFIKVDEFEEHLKYLLNKEINEQLEAQKLKEYKKNLCKIKVIVPSMPIPDSPSSSSASSTNSSLSSSSIFLENKSSSSETENNNSYNADLSTNNPSFSKKLEKYIEIHQDLTMDKAKLEVIKELNLNDYLTLTNQKCRIVKYDATNEMIEQSYQNETELTVIEALDFSKTPFNLNWYVEILPENEEFVDYKSTDLNVKIHNTNLETLESIELFTLRLNKDSMVCELRDKISKKISSDPARIRMALEKSYVLYNYVYLNKYLNDSLRSQNFTRVNKVFIESQDENDFNKPFETSKFYYALDTIINMISISVYLPVEEQCDLFLRKTKRRNDYIDLKRKLAELQNNDEDTIASEQTMSSILAESTCEYGVQVQQTHQTSPKNSVKFNLNKKLINNELEIDDSMSKMSYQESNNLNLVENHFNKNDEKICTNEMETSLDEGIGGSDGSLSTNNLNLKSSPNDMNWYDLKIRPCLDNPLKNIKDDEETNLEVDRSPPCDDVGDLDVNIDDNEINNLDDDLDVDSHVDMNNYNENNDDFSSSNQNYTSASSTTILSVNKIYHDDLNSKIQSSNFDNNDQMLNNEQTYNLLSVNNQNLAKNTVPELDELPKYSDLDKDSYGCYQVKNKIERFIKSNLIVNQELGTRTVEIKMDKRIGLTNLKTHLNEYLNIGIDNFRVFRMNSNDSESELGENDFPNTMQTTKFLVKLGRVLKYGEYLLPIYKLNKSKGSFSYLCDFMFVNGLSVLDHKEMLIEDLKDECNLDMSIDKLRLRKKFSKRPGNIFLDSEIFGADLYLNSNVELCIEALDEAETKTNKNHTSVYLRHWSPERYELEYLEEILLDGNSFELLVDYISKKSGIETENIEVLKCLRDFPFKSPILDLHRNIAWKENGFLKAEKLEDGACFYYRNKTTRLGELSSERRKEIEKEDNLNFRSTVNFTTNRKETGIKIHVENS